MTVRLFNEWKNEIDFGKFENLQDNFDEIFKDVYGFEVDSDGAEFLEEISGRSIPTIKHWIFSGKYFWCDDLELFISKNDISNFVMELEEWFW